MSATIKLTSKRQATFPVEVCQSLGISQGDEIELIPRMENGETCWILHKRKKPERPWFGLLSAYAKNAEGHSMAAIRKSIARGRTTGT